MFPGDIKIKKNASINLIAMVNFFSTQKQLPWTKTINVSLPWVDFRKVITLQIELNSYAEFLLLSKQEQLLNS